MLLALTRLDKCMKGYSMNDLQLAHIPVTKAETRLRKPVTDVTEALFDFTCRSKNFSFEERPSDSPFVAAVWRTQAETVWSTHMMNPDLFLFRRLFRNHHRPEDFVAGLIVASDRNSDAVGPRLQEVRVVARRVLPHAERVRPRLRAGRDVFSRPVRIRAGDPRRERAGHAVIHDAGGGHRLGLPLGNRRELRVGLDSRQAVLAPVARDHLCHIVRVRQRGRDGHDDAKRERLSPISLQNTHRSP